MTTQASPTFSNASVATSDKALIILSHLSALLGVGLLLPFIVWLVKKGEPDMVAAHAAEALNFHLSVLLYCLLLIPFCIILVGIPLLILVGLASVILAIVAAVRASDGAFYRYPLTIRLVK
jgi:uncharacterized Tic20 family protein